MDEVLAKLPAATPLVDVLKDIARPFWEMEGPEWQKKEYNDSFDDYVRWAVCLLHAQSEFDMSTKDFARALYKGGIKPYETLLDVEEALKCSNVSDYDKIMKAIDHFANTAAPLSHLTRTLNRDEGWAIFRKRFIAFFNEGR